MKYLIIFIVAFLTTFSLIQYVKQNMQGRKWVYPILLASLPFFYFIFALWINDKDALKSEFVVGLLFFIIVGLYFRYRTVEIEYLLIAGFFLHGFYDLGHNWFFDNMGVPNGWGIFCAMFNSFIAIYLMLQLKKQKFIS